MGGDSRRHFINSRVRRDATSSTGRPFVQSFPDGRGLGGIFTTRHSRRYPPRSTQSHRPVGSPQSQPCQAEPDPVGPRRGCHSSSDGDSDWGSLRNRPSPVSLPEPTDRFSFDVVNERPPIRSDRTGTRVRRRRVGVGNRGHVCHDGDPARVRFFPQHLVLPLDVGLRRRHLLDRLRLYRDDDAGRHVGNPRIFGTVRSNVFEPRSIGGVFASDRWFDAGFGRRDGDRNDGVSVSVFEPDLCVAV